ncbi:uncharacterized protein LOC122060041 isoform X2 [Macadamia integrifolia]|uniref:uncharacterized protein LOC122060041 isoform X2 n=1 Tax=Macadamia integrifolia TaxID=60698 RepID=UPI001C4E73F1|nr:uncharacterized protein LOC122060041 isoform X2 [Macadamia integrifolia]
MSAVAENSMADEEIGFRRPRNQPIIASDRDPKIPSIIQSIRCKSTISFFLSTFTNNSNNNNNDSDESSRLQLRKKNFTSITFRTFRGLGCATSSQVSAPKVIRSSADWQAKKVRKKKQRNPHTKKNLQGLTASPTSFAVVPDVWCSPGISFVADTDPIDCVIARRPVAGRGRVDGERMNHREIVMFQGSLLLGGGSDQLDQYRDWRLDIDNMSYEELLELGDRIGYVSNGLKEDEILRCLRKSKNMIMDDLPSTLLSEPEWKCSVCQEEYEADDAEVGKLDCGHSFHICCIKKWLVRKNACPVCKAIAAVQQ